MGVTSLSSCGLILHVPVMMAIERHIAQIALRSVALRYRNLRTFQIIS